MAGMNSPNPECHVVLAGEHGFIARNLAQHCLEREEILLEPGEGEASTLPRVIFYIFDDVTLNNGSASCEISAEQKRQEIAGLLGDDYSHLIILAKPENTDLLAILALAGSDRISLVTLVDVFGKWAVQDESNLVGQACFKVSAHKEAEFTFFGKRKFLYVDDLCRSLLGGITASAYVPVVPGPVYEISTETLTRALCNIRDSRATQIVPPVGSELMRALYATYISYLDKKDFSYPLDNHADERGSFIEFLKTEKHGQISCLTAKPGVTRGQHYHHSKCERFLVLQGTAKFAFRNLLNDEAHEITVSAETPEVVESIPGWVHNIKNVGTEELIVVLWANEVFNPALPDTNQAEM